jgi:hypothetical protein
MTAHGPWYFLDLIEEINRRNWSNFCLSKLPALALLGLPLLPQRIAPHDPRFCNPDGFAPG